MRIHSTLVLVLSAAALPLGAQTTLRAAPSTSATVEVALNPPRVEGQPAAPAKKIRIVYGQPHARGRTVIGTLAAEMDTVWRLGANTSTTLTTDVDLDVGGTTVPQGNYSLYALTSSKGEWKLIINKNTGQWGTTYDKAHDLARVSLTSTELHQPIESLSITLVPAAGDGAPKGDLRIIWGTRAFATTWAVK
jgi:hypothetical protein